MTLTHTWCDRKYGKLVHYVAWPGSHRLVVSDPTSLRHVLLAKQRSYPRPQRQLRLLREILGEHSLLATEGDVHSVARRHLNPHFRFANVALLLPIFVRTAHRLADRWDRLTGKSGSVIDVHRELSHFTLDVIGLSGFGYDFNALSGDANTVTESVNALNIPLSLWVLVRSAIPWLNSLPFPSVAREKAARATIRETVARMVESRMKDATPVQSGHATLLDIMLGRTEGETSTAGNSSDVDDATAAPERMSKEEIADHCLTFVLAGHETTSNGLAWALLLLARHPEAVARAVAEVKAVVGDDTRNLRWEHLAELHHVWAIVQESLRLYPPAAMTLRVAASAEAMPFDGGKRTVHVPQGTLIFISPYVVHRLKDTWGPDAEEFRPSRWLKEAPPGTIRVKPAPYTYLPFLHGAHMCIGHQFAQREMIVALAVLLPKFAFAETSGKVEPRLRITLRPHTDGKVGLPMRVTRQESLKEG